MKMGTLSLDKYVNRMQWWSLVLVALVCGCSVQGAKVQAGPQAQTRAAEGGPQTYILIVGNNSYPNFPANMQLNGCERDAQLLQETLETVFKIPGANMKTLLGKEATRQGIQNGLDWLLGQSKPGDSLLFYYSGHGSQVKDENGDEADGLDETLCPYDFAFTDGYNGKNAFVDDEIQTVLAEKAKNREFVAVYDCCHSGTGLRSLFSQKNQRKVRYLYPTAPASPPSRPASTGGTRSILGGDYVDPPKQDAGKPQMDFIQTRRLSEDLSLDKPAKESSATGTTGLDNVVLMAAARDQELAAESVGKLREDDLPEVHGIFTLELCRLLLQHPDPTKITYGDLRQNLSRPIVQGGNIQNPQVETNSRAMLEKPFLGGLRGLSTVEKKEPEKEETPKPRPQKTEVASETSFPQLLKVSFRRLDELVDGSRKFSSTLSREMAKDLEEDAAGMKDVVEVCAPDEVTHVVVAYGAEETGSGITYFTGIFDQNAELVKQAESARLSQVKTGIRQELERAWLSMNLMLMRPPVSSNRNVNFAVTSDGVKQREYEERAIGVKGMQVEERARFKAGEKISFNVQPSHDGYLTLVNIDCEGGMAVIYPNSESRKGDNPKGFFRGGQKLRIPPKDAIYYFYVMPPFGKESVKVFLTPEPLNLDLEQARWEQQRKSANSPVPALRGMVDTLDRKIGTAVKNTESPKTEAFDWMNSEEWAESVYTFITSPD